MCLAVPGKVIEIDDSSEYGLIDVMGVSRKVILATLDDKVNPGDYVLVHAGFAIRKVNTSEALKAIELHQIAIDNEEKEKSIGDV